MAMKLHDRFVGSAYAVFLACLLATVASCAQESRSAKGTPIPSEVSCESSADSFRAAATDEPLDSLDLTPGVYEYVRGEMFFQGTIGGKTVAVQSRENVSLDADSRRYEITHSFVCRQGFDSSASLEFDHESVAPRLFRIREADVDVAYRKFGLQSAHGQPAYRFDDAPATMKVHRYVFEETLRKSWDEFRFVHTGYKTYVFTGTRKVSGGVIRVRVVFLKTEGDIFQDGDFFSPLPDVHF